MHIARGSSFAFHALAHMALVPGGPSFGASELAEAIGASPSYMAKLLQKLVHAGLVTSRRGAGGGFSLARPATAITLDRIILAVSDAPADVPLLPSCATCRLADVCPITEAVRRAEESMEAQFRTLTVDVLAQLLRGPDGHTDRMLRDA